MKKAQYSAKEEIFNEVSHIIGAVLGLIGLILCIIVSSFHHSLVGILTSIVYGLSMIILYTMSSVYHGLKPGKAKDIMRIFDHCTIFILIAGTYTPITLCKLAPEYPLIGWGVFAFEWIVCVIAILMTAVDLHKTQPFALLCMLLTGWAIAPFYQQLINTVGMTGFYLILAGGIAYTIGAILYGLGSKYSVMHSVFHILVLIGSVLQLIAILLYVL